jgi:plastocyanin
MRAIVLAVLAAAVVVGCGTGPGSDQPAALGFESPPAGLDPASPTLVAKDVAFTAVDVDVPAGTAFVLVFENHESLPHNVSIYADAAFANRVFEGVTFSGPATRWYPVPALPAGGYVFRCDLHPNMTGRLHAT